MQFYGDNIELSSGLVKANILRRAKNFGEPDTENSNFPIVLMNAVLHTPPQKSQLTLNTTKKLKKKYSS